MNMIMMMKMRLIRRLLHKFGMHNKRCKRRYFIEENTYICLITGKKFKKINYELFKAFKKV